MHSVHVRTAQPSTYIRAMIAVGSHAMLRVAWMLALLGCVNVRPFVPIADRCESLPEVPVDRPADAPPPVHLAHPTRGAEEAIHASPIPASCDPRGNCDYVLFYIEHDCPARVGIVSAHHFTGDLWTFATVERVIIDGAPYDRTRWWRIDHDAVVPDRDGQYVDQPAADASGDAPTRSEAGDA